MNILVSTSKRNTFYNCKNNILHVSGWVLAEKTISAIHIDGQTAEYGLQRMDVYNSHPEFDDKNAGFEFEIYKEEFMGEVRIDIICENEIIYSQKNIIPIIKYENNWNELSKATVLGVDDSIERLIYNCPNLMIEEYVEKDKKGSKSYFHGREIINYSDYNLDMNKKYRC